MCECQPTQRIARRREDKKNDVRAHHDRRQRVTMQRVESAGKRITDSRRVLSQTQWRNRTERFLNQPRDSSYTQYTSTKTKEEEEKDEPSGAAERDRRRKGNVRRKDSKDTSDDKAREMNGCEGMTAPGV